MRGTLRSRMVLMAAWATSPALAADIAASGSWAVVVDATDLQAGAGSDLTSESSSAAAAIVLDLTNLLSASDAWRVDISRADASWDGDVRLWVSRTSTGTGPGTVTGGSGWIEVTSTPTTFFSGTGARAGVGVQLKVTGLAVGALPPDLYASNVTYTLVDTP